ncbi:MAG: restriction endonuclease subunit S [Limimaricola soesokkakensis]|uniref:restriction endonuclease subunit S n=1 Tax=Limimaricola soesokkakensis TaxID=1343159 RepID=UPI0040585DAF
MSWPVRKFASLVSDGKHSIVGGPFGSKLTSRDYVEEGIPVIRGANMGAGRHLDENHFVFVSEAKKNKDLQSNLARPGDIVFTQRGTLGQVAIIPEDSAHKEYVVSQSQMRATLDPKKACKKFYYYFFSSRKVVETILNLTSSSGVPHINLGTLKYFDVPVPDLPTQERIAGVLSAYDDLIDNNRRRIALLEQAARLLYREWFVHFRFPGHETASFIDGLPEGWSIRELSQVADFHLGKMLDQRKNKGTMRPYLANKNVRWGEFDHAELREMRFEDRELERFSVKDGDIVMCEGGEPGRCAIWRDEVPNMMYQKALHRIRPNDGIGPNFLFHELTHRAKGGYLTGLFTGATIKHLPKEKLALAKVCLPTGELIGEFESIAEPMGKQISELHKTNAKIAKARDLLLPRLMDGRLPIPE